MRKFKKSEKNSKQRKLKWIRAKNLMTKYPDCSYNGDFYCDHIYDPEYKWSWVDFRFFHTKLKRYFAVSMNTVKEEAYSLAEQQTMNESQKLFLKPSFDDFDELYNWFISKRLLHSKSVKFEEKRLKELLDQEWTITPRIEIKDYGSVSVGVWVVINKDHIDEHVIREFIEEFRKLGEPITPGWVFKYEDVIVGPQKY